MLSAIQSVKLPSSTQPASPPNQDIIKKEQQQQSNSNIRVSDMSRRKQRNPKPIFNAVGDDDDHGLHQDKPTDKSPR
jgi:hypothetical protein